jgi:multimeric flavodoxin WrbA
LVASQDIWLAFLIGFGFLPLVTFIVENCAIKVGAALSVAWGRNAGVEITLMTLLSAFMVLEMIPVGPYHRSGAALGGAAGLSSGGGMGKFDPEDKLGVLKDEWGLRGARLLGQRVVEVTRLIKAGAKQTSW